MTPSLRAALALAVLMIRDRMTYRFAGFGAMRYHSRWGSFFSTSLLERSPAIQPTEVVNIGIDSQGSDSLGVFLTLNCMWYHESQQTESVSTLARPRPGSVVVEKVPAFQMLAPNHGQWCVATPFILCRRCDPLGRLAPRIMPPHRF